LIDIRRNIHLAQRYVEGLSYEAFRDSVLVFYTVTRALEIISEASRRLPAETKERRLPSPWAEMAGAGNVYRHDCEDVQERLVWGVVHLRLPALLAMIENELANLNGEP
jgi:uncharacterized protein with HEPN domain